MDLFKELDNLKTNNISNLNNYELNVLKKFVKQKPFKVVELDKNIGSSIISNELYEKLASDILEDVNTYTRIEENPLPSVVNEIKNEVYRLFEQKHLSKKLFKQIKDVTGKLGSFRLLPKLTKDIFSCRQIINYKNHFTNVFCLIIDFILKPYVNSSESFILDSQNLIQKLEKLHVSNEYTLLTGDFTSLYSNINHNDCLNMFCDFFKDKLDNEHIDIISFKTFLNIILKNNFFTYNNKYYLQILGIAMGSICGPSIANIFVYLYEKKWLYIHKPLVYLRFIDDIFIIFLKHLNVVNSLLNAFGSLKLNVEVNNKVHFLDLEISIDELACRLNFSVYFKPTNTFSYLYILSNHPNFIFKNLAKSLFIRIRRNCTKFNKFVFFSRIIAYHLAKRGHCKELIDKSFTMVSSLDRSSLIPYKNKESFNSGKCFTYKFNFDQNIINFGCILKKAFNNFKERNDKFKDYEIRMINKMQPNLSSLFVHNFKFPFVRKNSFKKCNKNVCSTCKYSNSNHFIYLTENFILPVLDNSNCKSENCIYIIFCGLCNAFYIGQTINLKDRVYNHIYCIKNFKPYLLEDFKCVSLHFNLKFHNYKKHLSFFVIKNNINSLNLRLYIESFLINLCVRLKLNLINDFIPEIRDFEN